MLKSGIQDIIQRKKRYNEYRLFLNKLSLQRYFVKLFVLSIFQTKKHEKNW